MLIEMAHRLTDNLQVFTLDTGRLHPETYEFIERVRKHYGINIEVLFPDAAEVQDLVNRKGLFSFFEDGHSECWRHSQSKTLFVANWLPSMRGSPDSVKIRARARVMMFRLCRKTRRSPPTPKP